VCCSYDDPRNNVTPAFPPVPGCNLAAIYPGAGFPAALNANINVGWANQSDCINYAGSCGPPRRGADVLAGFGRPLQQRLMWIDGLETSFNSSTLPGDHCNFAGGGDCELRASGPRPVASAIEAIADYLKPVIQCDGAVPCRKYSVILLSGGTESCMGNPVASATALRSNVPGTQVNLYVIGLSVLPSEQAQLNALAAAGGTGAAFFASDQAGLSNAIATIAASSTNYEKCNGLDDNCNALVDEDFPDKGQPCDDGKAGVCRGTGVRVCNAAGDGTVCQITNPGGAASPEVCNGLDDDCDGLVDDGGVCAFCSPSPEVCNGLDDDCNGLTDDAPLDADQPCGLSLGECAPGLTSCVAGQLGCSGAIGPQPEACNGLDDDCDGIVDGMAAPCYSGPSGTSGVGLCRPGLQACTAAAGSGVPSWGACVGAVLPSDETCNGLDDDCDGVSDDHVADAMGHVTGEPCCQFADKCGTGACTFGAWACAGSQIVCAGGAGPTAERCNGVDDDCNGLTDDVPGIGSSCVTADFCAGALICEGTSGALRCAPAAGLEICNGADDDCDGTVDNPGAVAKNDPAIGVECSAPVAPYDHAPCKAGKSECVDGAARCVGAVLAAAESCNGLDDDCDGVTDGPGLCPAGTDCHRGSCQVPCEAGAAACPGQFRCVDGYCESPPDAGWPGVDAGEPEDSGAAADASPPGLDAGETIPMDASAPRDDASTAAAADAGGGGASAPGCSCQAGSGQAVPSTLLGLLLLGRLLSKGRRKAVRS
jgi:MYXO-CTERM domain-containing protein